MPKSSRFYFSVLHCSEVFPYLLSLFDVSKSQKRPLESTGNGDAQAFAAAAAAWGNRVAPLQNRDHDE